VVHTVPSQNSNSNDRILVAVNGLGGPSRPAGRQSSRKASKAVEMPSRREVAATCAPAKNLNSAFPHFATAHDVYAHLRNISKNDSKECAATGPKGRFSQQFSHPTRHDTH
jgi:hypothetical protein